MKDFFREMLLLSGFAATVYGMWLIYPPAALIIGGSALMWLCAPAGQRKKDKGEAK